MFGREPKPGSRKAQKKFNQFVDSQKASDQRFEYNSLHQAGQEWDAYKLDHPEAQDYVSGKMHPVRSQMYAEHRSRMQEYNQAALDTTNDVYRRLNGIKDPNHELIPTSRGDVLHETHNHMLNSQQFGKLPEYGENY